MTEEEKKEKKELKELKKQKKNEKKALKKLRPLSEKEELIRKRNEPPKLSTLEEIGNSITHGIGAIFGIVALILMLLNAKNGRLIFASYVYGFSIIIMMTMSSLYHAWRSGSTVKRIFRRFDYSSIYLLIGGTFAPLLLYELNENANVPIWIGICWFSIMWALIITGITFTCIFGPGAVRFINYPLYFLLGWTGIAFLPIWIIAGRIEILLWILIGGILYTVGMIPFAKKGVKAAHFIWHFFVLAGAIVQFVGIYIYLY